MLHKTVCDKYPCGVYQDLPDNRIFTSIIKGHRKKNESHHMGNVWVLQSTFHSTGKCNKTHCMGKTWEIGTHTFPIVRALFSHLIPILWYTSSYGKSTGFPINFP